MINYDTIDDEFASLFLKELQKTTNGITFTNGNNNNNNSNNNNNNNNVDLINAQFFQSLNEKNSETFSEPIVGTTNNDNNKKRTYDEFETNSTASQLVSQTSHVTTAHATYDIYLPPETTLSSTFFGMNDNYVSSNYDTDIKNTITNNRQGTFVKSESATNTADEPAIATYKDRKDMDEPDNLNGALLKFQILDEKNIPFLLTGDCSGVFNVDCSLDGRFYIEKHTLSLLLGKPQVDENPSSDNSCGTVTDNDQITLFCYRRNFISIKLEFSFPFDSTGIQSLYLKKTKNEENAIEISKLRFKVYCSLRKSTSDDDDSFKVIVPMEQFVMPKNNEVLKKNKDGNFVLKCSEYEIPITKLGDYYNANTDCFIVEWDQIKFKSATANNRHDAKDKFYVVTTSIEFLDKFNEPVYNTKLESLPVMVRGRNPSFYSDKGDIFLGKLKSNHLVSFKAENSNDLKNDHVVKKSRKKSPSKNQISEETSNASSPSSAPVSNTNLASMNNSQESLVVDGLNYHYFKMDNNYYLPPIEVGYFPHYVHHNKQVFKLQAPPSNRQNEEDSSTHYNYFM
ncbi:uncharacterized protein SCODWIG_00520 [Saccharomycodes ludwigii]|uniref:NDT80 domain-containing protein n=1 Tax=Saccharomycodes ludwigii TaxID=36035 RepID=A0A376B2B5_9ASCO|nr:hypothetical protein SCDLUD_004979 [Saccharomycodes ludwigii]KAH3898657.1 hypothetical protein SCDLUD_004979 [Saccharomycodes ludwigii]SSD58759.1 uncharacterized protein SCODWIG_00520 [Saccharomycodes ludwigii]